jgi:hypothetical protein
MGRLQRSVASLRICGDDLQPSEITERLGCPPTVGRTKGERIVGPSSGQSWIAKTGMWRLDAPDAAPEDLNAQISALLAMLPTDRAVWQSIAAQYEVDVFCGLFMASTNDVLALSSATLEALGQRGIELVLDIYDSGEEN